MEEDSKDEEIVSRIQAGEIEPFSILVKRYEAKMMRYARKFLITQGDAEDLVQDVFLKAYVNIQSFDTSRRFSPWLYRIAHNTFINAIKKRGEEVPFFDVDTLFPHPTTNETGESDLERKELKTKLDISLNKLPPKYREPLVLHYFEELSYKEIAEVLRIPVSTVGVRLRRGKNVMKKLYDEHEK